MPMAIAVCDQVQLFREGVARVLDVKRYEVVLSVRSLKEIAENQTVRNPIDVIILGVDDDLPIEHKIASVETSAQHGPLVVVLATSTTRALIRNAISSGVRAVLPKDISGEILSSALELVLCGHQFFPAYDDPDESDSESMMPSTPGMITAATDVMSVRLLAPDDDDIQLSEREEQILCRLISGAPNKSIARDLAITDATVKVHIKGLLRKLRVINRTQAAIWGVNHGIHSGRRMAKRVNGTLNGVHLSS